MNNGNKNEDQDKEMSSGMASGVIAFAGWLLGLAILPIVGSMAPIWLSFVLGGAFFASLIGGSFYWATDGVKNIKNAYNNWKEKRMQKKLKKIDKIIELKKELESSPEVTTEDLDDAEYDRTQATGLVGKMANNKTVNDATEISSLNSGEEDVNDVTDEDTPDLRL